MEEPGPGRLWAEGRLAWEAEGPLAPQKGLPREGQGRESKWTIN